MVEILQSNENELDKEVEEAISGFREEEKVLEDDVNDYQDPEKIKSVEKLPNGKVRFPYESNEHECSLILEKKWNNIFVKLEKIPTYMWNPMDNEFKKPEKKQRLTWKIIDASSSDVFLKWLWKALDDIIGKWRVSAADKAQEAYKLLWFDKN